MAFFRCGSNASESGGFGDKLSHLQFGTSSELSINLPKGETYMFAVGVHRNGANLNSITMTSSNGDDVPMQFFKTAETSQGSTGNGYSTSPFTPSSDTTVTLSISPTTSIDECYIAAIHTDHLN